MHFETESRSRHKGNFYLWPFFNRI